MLISYALILESQQHYMQHGRHHLTLRKLFREHAATEMTTVLSAK